MIGIWYRPSEMIQWRYLRPGQPAIAAKILIPLLDTSKLSDQQKAAFRSIRNLGRNSSILDRL